MASSIQNFDLEYLASAIADQVKTRLALKQDTLQLDAVPTQNSTKFVNSGGIKTALDSLPKIYLFTTAQWNALTNEQKATYLGNIVYITDDGSGIGGQIDSVPTDGSTNLVTSNGVYDAINDVSEAVDEKSDLSNIVDETKSETEVTAEKQHNAGEYFDIYGTLVKATDDIAIGDTLTEGVNGNYETTDITSELLSMKSSFTAGCNTIVSAVTAKGQTPVSNSPSAIATAISNIQVGDETHGAINQTEFNNMSNADLLALNEGDNTIGDSINVNQTATRVITSGDKEYTFTLNYSHTNSCKINKEDTTSKVYGVSWSGGTSPAMTRTDAAALFSDPSPAVNNGNGSSPFDNILPWSGMEIVDDSTGGKLVSIPKYYYKWIKSGDAMTLQISMKQESGFHCSPAHADRGDGKGERDTVYVGRYHCATSTYKSTSDVAPQASQPRSAFRSSIHNLGNEYWQYDFAMYWTIMMLYIVEYANWHSQAVIGYGCSDSGSVQNSGATDGMTYHTGTSASNRKTYGHTQYRHIEDLWGNVYDWCDGIYFSGSSVYVINNPSSFSDTTGGIKVGTRSTSSGEIKSFFIPTALGLEWALYPDRVESGNYSYDTYVCDLGYYDYGGVVLFVGGSYDKNGGSGAFYMYGRYAATFSSAIVGSRLQKLP